MRHRKSTVKAIKKRLSTHDGLVFIGGAAVGSLLLIAGSLLLWSTVSQMLAENSLHRHVIESPEPLRQLTARSSSIIALRRAADSDSPLLVFLPATGTSTRLYSAFESTAVNGGFHVLALPYANRRTERSICKSDAACYQQVRDEQMAGTRSPFLPSIATQASVQTTLVFALDTLQKTDPQGGWGAYLAGRSIAWSHIVVAGHSQGGGLAAYIAHRHHVKGVIMFSSPNDVHLTTHTFGAWVNSASATPADRYFGLMDTHDFYAPSTTAVWHAMFPNVAIEKSDGVKQLSGHLFSTSATHFPEALTAHFAVATNQSYEPVWQYFLKETY